MTSVAAPISVVRQFFAQSGWVIDVVLGSPTIAGWCRTAVAWGAGRGTGLNGVFLRRGPGGLHNATLPDAYVGSVNQRIVDANAIGGRAAALDELAAMKDELMFLQSFIP